MASPYSTGGGGTHFEARVVAAALASVLCEGSLRGLLGDHAIEVRTQRASFVEPLDDLIVTGTGSNGGRSKLHLQIKNRLTYTANDDEWAAVLKAAWDTFSGAGFNQSVERVGAAVGSYSARADQHYLSVLIWAQHSVDGDHFAERIQKEGFSHADQRDFVATVSTVVSSHVGRALTNDEIWRFLKCFVIIYFDFQTGANSRDEAITVDRLRAFLPAKDRSDAGKVWDFLVTTASELIPVGGGASREALIEALKAAGLPTGVSHSLLSDIVTLNKESLRILADIRHDIAGLKLPRPALRDEATSALSEARFVQLVGEPGTGKSALLKEIAEESAALGPILVLKDGRIHPHGWSSHAHVLNVSEDVGSLLREFSCCGSSIVFIDGIDKITDASEQLTINDVLRAIVANDNLSDWRVLVTVREQNLKHLDTWLDEKVVSKLKVSTVSVVHLDRDELRLVAREVPRLAPLLSATGDLDIVLSRPFFLNAVARLGPNGETGKLPATEVELLQLWWRFGGADGIDEVSAQARRNTLVVLARGLAVSGAKGIAIRDVDPLPLSELKAAGVVRDREFGHSVVFAHDIYEEWALCELLIGTRGQLAAFLVDAKEQDLLIRPFQLLGTYALETDQSTDVWKEILGEVAVDTLRPVWQRAVLTSCFQSTRATELLGKLSPDLLESKGGRLKKLLLAIATIEVTPNTLYLDEAILPDSEPSERARIAQRLALPKPIIWVRFLDWLVPRLSELPPGLVPDLLPVFTSWQETYAGRNIRHCKEIGAFSHRWLIEVEAAMHPSRWKDRRRPFGEEVEYGDEEKIEKQLRSLFFTSTPEIPDLVRSYLKEKSEKRRRNFFRDAVLENFAPLVRHLPGELVDYILAAFLERPGDNRDQWGSFDTHLIDELGIGGHQFYPASPAQPPFLLLLRLHEAEGLRLIRALCNHSIAIWRWRSTHPSHYRSAATPVPVKVRLAWGQRSFWGDNQVYVWFRGYWGNTAVRSGLMALEQWALEKIDAGTPFDEIFQKVVDGNSSVAALGLGVSLCLAHPEKAAAAALSLVTCPHLWMWDIARTVQETGMPANEIGNWYQDRFQLQAVRKLNQRAHRRQDIRALVHLYLFSEDKAARTRYLRGLRSFPKRLPFIYEEEASFPDHVAELLERMTLFAEQGDPKNAKMARTADGQNIQVWIEPPSLQKPKYQAQAAEHRELNTYMGLALWATKSLEDGKLQPQFSVTQAVEEAKKFDSDTLFDRLFGPENMLQQQRAAAVAGTAAVAAHYIPSDEWTPEIGAWCIEVLQRSATAPEEREDLFSRGMHLVMHPAVFAAQGYSSLLGRGFQPQLCMNALLSLAVDAMESVMEAVFASAATYASSQPDFYRTLLSVGMELCVVPRDHLPDYHAPHWDETEAEDKLAILARAEKALETGVPLQLPDMPHPWVFVGGDYRSGGTDTKGFAKNNLEFMFHLAPKVLFKSDLPTLMRDADGRAKFLTLVGQLLDWTLEEIVPPFADSRRQNGGNSPFEWIYGFAFWCGRLSALLTAEECRTVILSRVWKQDTETSLLIMQSLMRSFMINAFLVPTRIEEEQFAIWNEIAVWLFNNPEWTRGKDRDHLDREFQSCAHALLFCVAPDFSPLTCGVDPGWPQLRKFVPLIERAVREFGVNAELYFAVIVFLKGGGFDLFPQPALIWLRDIVAAKKQDLRFWMSNGNTTVELVSQIVEKAGDSLTPGDRQTITLICDILVDNGVRGAGFFQQELQRAK